MSTSAASSSRLPSIDLLRGVAALAVVVSHLPFHWERAVPNVHDAGRALPRWLEAPMSLGSYGVNLFLVISGFCIHMRWARAREHDARVQFFAFWKRRLSRLYPPYVAALACSLAWCAVVTHLSRRPVHGIGSFFGYPTDLALFVDLVVLLLLAQNLTEAAWRAGNGAFWTLALEEQLYMLYFPFLAVRRRWGWKPAIVLVVAVTFAWRAAFVNDADAPEFWYLVGPARWFEWVLGAVAVEMHLGRLRVSRWLSSPVTLAAAVLASLVVAPVAFTDDHPAWIYPGPFAINDVIVGFGSFVLLNWCCELDRRGALSRSRLASLLASVGTFSYSLYLVHHVAMSAAQRRAEGAGIEGVATVVGLRLGAALLAGYLFFRVVESRFLTGPRPPAARSD
jgi:peptidoglycan/LPS O-acetylase OafA/YrhL